MNPVTTRHVSRIALAVAIALVCAAWPAAAQHAGHGHDMPMPAEPAKAAPTAGAKPVQAEPATDAQASPSAGPDAMGHAAMGHGPDETARAPSATDGGDGQAQETHADHSEMDHARMDHSAMEHAEMPAPATPREPIPVVTDADRRAAFPDVDGHAVHDDAIHSYWLLDRLEAWDADEGRGMAWEGQAWVGTDTNRLWLRSEGERIDGHTESADLEVLYGRSIARWWDLLVGVRHDFKPGDAQHFAAVGIMGLAPQKFEVEAMAYVGEHGQTAARLEAEYDLLLTNRLILQPLLEAEFHGKDDPARGVGSGLGTVELGLRLRYHLRREFAPYIGIVRERAFGTTADYRRQEGEEINDTRFVAGLRIWF